MAYHALIPFEDKGFYSGKIMPDHEEMEYPKRVFVLGAGLSAECGAPLIANFLSEPFLNLISPEKRSIIVDFLRTIENGETILNIEDVLGLIDTNIVRGNSIGLYNPSKLLQMRRTVLEAINEILTRIWDTINEELGVEKIDNPYAVQLSEIGESKEIHRTKIIRMLAAELEFFSQSREKNVTIINELPPRAEGWINSYVRLTGILKPNDTIITFNYDNFLELALSNILEREDIDLGFDYFELSPDMDVLCHGDLCNRIRTPDYVKYKITVLRPHGSLNWGICSNCGELIVTYLTPLLGVKKYIDFIKNSANKKEKERHFCCKNFDPQLLIVEPTWMKLYTNYYLGQVIENTIQKMAEADEIFFIGYSFSDSDSLIRDILTKSLHMRADKYWDSIFIINTSQEAIVRYQGFFPSLNVHEKRASEFLSEMPRYEGLWRDPPEVVGTDII